MSGLRSYLLLVLRIEIAKSVSMRIYKKLDYYMAFEISQYFFLSSCVNSVAYAQRLRV